MAVLLLFIITTKGNKASTTEIKGKIKRSKSRVLYYHNTSATFYIILKADDVEKNPGPGLHQQSNVTDPVVTAPRNRNVSSKCTVCEKGVGTSRKRLLCTHCYEILMSLV